MPYEYKWKSPRVFQFYSRQIVARSPRELCKNCFDICAGIRVHIWESQSETMREARSCEPKAIKLTSSISFQPRRNYKPKKERLNRVIIPVVDRVFARMHCIDRLKSAFANMSLTLELPRQSNWLVLQFYFKIPTSCYIFIPQWCNDLCNDNWKNNIMNFILFFMYSN